MTVPTKWVIAQHWMTAANSDTFAPCLDDIAALRCFACGWFSERWAKGTPKASWERVSLERAHIVPASLGGSSDVGNLILLCKQCHEESPDWPDPNAMARWIAERPERSSQGHESLLEWFAAMNSEQDAVAHLADLEAAEAVDLLMQSARRSGLHAGSLSAGTKRAIVRHAGELAAAASEDIGL
jgi:HNH endonuclease